MPDKTDSNSLLTYILLAFIAMAGLSYINFMPGVVNALAGSIGFNDSEAGQIVAFNGYGGILGSSIAIFLVRRFPWKAIMMITMAVLVVIDVCTVWISDYSVMLGWRFLSGVLGGLCVGFAFSILARQDDPDRAFGLLLFIQFSIGPMVMFVLPSLESMLGGYSVFFVMAGLVFLSLIFMFCLPKLLTDIAPAAPTVAANKNIFGRSLLLLLAIAFYQIAANAIWAYVGLIGLRAEISNENVNLYIGATGLLGIAGAMLPIINGNRAGRLFWVVAGMVLSTASAVLLNFSHIVALYITAMSLLFFSWTAVQSYLLAVTAELDTSGRLSTIASVVASLGFATGPLLASFLLDDDNFSNMLYACAIIFVLSFLFLLNPVRKQEQTTATADFVAY
ncbi:MFS transporter [Sessilibacter corallicola]|uniref:Major facilitator superfamily (MFS) profile domain-containing protein n=1 Tax=Sessilibacter corallicola TaxID=2904075 RepID=A0ABQ0ACJ9_9GAMM